MEDLLPVLSDDLLDGTADDLLDGTAISSLLFVDLLTLVPDDLVPEALLLLLKDSAMVDCIERCLFYVSRGECPLWQAGSKEKGQQIVTVIFFLLVQLGTWYNAR